MKLEKKAYLGGYKEFKNCHNTPGLTLELNILNPTPDDLKFIYSYLYHSVDMILEFREPILDNAERRYLSSVIRPFRDRVKDIRKLKEHFIGDEYILIRTDKNVTPLPYFKAGTMYKNLELNKKYTLEELGL